MLNMKLDSSNYKYIGVVFFLLILWFSWPFFKKQICPKPSTSVVSKPSVIKPSTPVVSKPSIIKSSSNVKPVITSGTIFNQKLQSNAKITNDIVSDSEQTIYEKM
jgi:hypothetical protein